TATVEINVTPVDDAPTAGANQYTTAQDTKLNVTSTALFNHGSTWSYLDKLENGLHIVGGTTADAEDYPLDAEFDQWFEEDYDTASGNSAGAWQTGRGVFASPIHSMTPDGTTFLEGIDDSVNVAGENSVTTYLFRRTFNIASGAAARTSLVTSIIAEDGGIIRINGVEAAVVGEPDTRLNMPAGPITTTTFSAAGGDTDYQVYTLSFPAGTLHDGVNTIAVEVHQVNVTSSDIGFDMALALDLNPGPGLLYNDTDVDGDAITAVTVSTPPTSGMIVSINNDGTFMYMPNAGFEGTDTFEYTVTANGVTSAPAVVTIEVTPVSCSFDADLDNDGDVDRADLAILTASYGSSTATPEQGDIDCDGSIGLLDLVRLRNSLTPPPPPSPEASAAVIQIARPSARTVIGSGNTESSTRLQIVRRDQQRTVAQPVSAARQPSGTVLRARRSAPAHDRAMDDMFGG
ncbi:MAG: Ig-like domain-containing protein, partial [Pirellulales bacterium]